MATQSQSCPVCSKPKQPLITGSFTQWIATCHCDKTDDTSELGYVCGTCGLRIEQDRLTDASQTLADACRCENPIYLPLTAQQAETIIVCRTCGKRIASQEGSMTQWVFGAGRCSCERPEPTEKPVESFIQPAFEGFRDDQSEQELELSNDKFPVERYKPVAVLGKGGAGVVYLCRDRLLDKKVAVKILLDLSAEQLISFQEEARATARLIHPNIVTVLDFGATSAGTPYMVLDYVRGISLQRYLIEHSRLDEDLARHVFLRLALALAYAHEQRVFHRDIKPSNIVLTETTEGLDVRLIDFGIAKVREATGSVTVYQDRTIAGTPTYMSPDTISGETYDARSEIYSLACVIFEALAGRPPFVGETALEVLAMHAEEQAPDLAEIRPDIDNTLIDLIARCLSKSKNSRPSSMREILRDLERELERTDDSPSGEPSEELRTISGVWQRNSLVGILSLASIGCLVLMAMLIISVNQSADSDRESQELSRDSIGSMNEQMVDAFEQTVPKLQLLSLGNNGLYSVDNSSKEKWTSQQLAMELRQSKDIRRLEFRELDLRSDLLEALYDSDISTLNLHACKLSTHTFKILARLKSLESLSLAGSSIGVSKALIELESLTNLKYLSLTELNLENGTIKVLPVISSLEELCLQDCTTGPGVIEQLRKMPRLSKLVIAGSNLERDCFAELKTVPSLKEVHVKSLSKDFFPTVKQMHLNRLVILGNPDVTEQQLLELASVKSIKELRITWCTKISPEFRDKFAKLNKVCDVSIKSNKATFVMPYEILLGD